MTRQAMMASVAVATMLALAGCKATPATTPDAAADAAAVASEGHAAAVAAPAAVTPPAPSADAAASANLATTPDTALAAMQGDWVSVEDPRSTLHITRNQVVMGYTGDAESPAPMRLDFVSECEGRTISGPRLGFTLTDDDMVLCYADLDVDADNLEYFYLPRGNRQAFRRAPSTSAPAH